MLLKTLPTGTPATVAFGRKQFAYVFQGNGVRPSRVDLTDGKIADMGVNTPTDAPQVATQGEPRYYVARIDVIEGGVGYNKPPAVTLDGGEPTRPATAKAYLTGTALGDVDVVDYGRGYKTAPTVNLSSTYGKDATFVALLDESVTPPVVGGPMTKWRTVAEPDGAVCLPGYDPSTSRWLWNGQTTAYWTAQDANGNTWSGSGGSTVDVSFEVEAPSRLGKTAARMSVRFDVIPRSSGGVIWYYAARVRFGSIVSGGSEYTAALDFVRPALTFPSDNSAPLATNCSGSSALRIRIEPDTISPETPNTLLPIKSVTFTPGSGYHTPPALTIDSNDGAGGALDVEVKDGKVVGVTVKKGGLYETPPTLTAETGGAKAVAIIRAHLRGKYDCFYRYVDNTPDGRDGPRPSNLSPVATIDAGEGVGSLLWSVPPYDPTDREYSLELWRTTSDQAYTVYRVAEVPFADIIPGSYYEFDDDLTDIELADFDRTGYAAMPVLLPNGELNANRFGVPPSNKAVAVMYQDRLWMAGDTSGDEPNVIRFSEYNEPESCPDVNELVLQSNVRVHDHITALIPYGASLGVMQTRHAYRLSYVSQPIIDASLQIAAYRGCLNQRCWDEHEGLVYCMDSQGIYALDQGGGADPISVGLADLFASKIDFDKSKWFSVVVDRQSRCLRCSVRYRGEDGEYPTRMLCYSFDYKGWWEERYPAPMVGGASVRDAYGSTSCLYGTDTGQILALNESQFDYSVGTVLDATLTNPGKGYKSMPTVKVGGGGTGAVVETALSHDGTILGIYIKYGGYGYTNPTIVFEGGNPTVPATGTLSSITGSDVRIPCWIKTGNMEYPHDSLPVEMKDTSRNVSLLFTPTSGKTLLKMRMYYNNSPHPRINVAARDRGTGEEYSTEEPAVVLDMDAGLLPDRISTGVCRALFSSHTVDDIKGNDRHVAVELRAKTGSAGPIVIHSMDVYGVPAGG
jgi:hypothetical protein